MFDKKLIKSIKSAWIFETCHPDVKKEWRSDNAEFGQCGVTALLIQEIYGGRIAINKKYHHVWNVLPDGKKIDITRSQFPKNTRIVREGFISRKDMFSNELAKKAKVKERYVLFRKRVFENLKIV